MKKVINILLSSAIILALTGCGGTSSETTTPTKDTTTATKKEATTNVSEDKEQATVIEIWTNNRHDETYMTEMINKFNAERKDIQIQYTIMADDYENSVQLAYQANTAPDIMTMSATDKVVLNEWVNSGMYESLSDYIAKDTEFQKITEPYDHQYEGLNSIGDNIYWVPNGVRSGTRIEYNKELVEGAGYEGIPSTVSEVIELCKAVTANGNGSSYGVGFTSASPFERWLEGAGLMSGYNYVGYDYTTGTYDFSQWKELVEVASKLFKDGSVLPGSETQGVDNSRALFAQGSFAIWGNASQEAGVFTNQFPCAFDWGVAELPTMTGEVKGALNCTPNLGYVMLSTAEDKDAAWEVIRYLSSEAFLKGYFENGYSAPMSSYMTEKVDTSKIGRLADFEIKDYEDVYPATPAITVEGDTYRKVLWNAVLGNITADEAVADLNKRYNEALEKGIKNGSCKRLIIKDFDPLHPSAGTQEYIAE